MSFFVVKASTLQISQSLSVLQEHPSSHFFKSSQILKFLNCFNSFLTVLKSLIALLSSVSSPVFAAKSLNFAIYSTASLALLLPPDFAEENSSCYPLCHMKISCSSGDFASLQAISSSKVTIFSFCLDCSFLGGRTVSGRNVLAMGASPDVMERSNSLMLRGTKYSTKGSAPESHNEFIITPMKLLRSIVTYNSLIVNKSYPYYS